MYLQPTYVTGFRKSGLILASDFAILKRHITKYIMVKLTNQNLLSYKFNDSKHFLQSCGLITGGVNPCKVKKLDANIRPLLHIWSPIYMSKLNVSTIIFGTVKSLAVRLIRSSIYLWLRVSKQNILEVYLRIKYPLSYKVLAKLKHARNVQNLCKINAIITCACKMALYQTPFARMILNSLYGVFLEL